MTDDEAAQKYAAAVAKMLEVGPIQQPTRDKARRFLMLALDYLA